MADITTKKILIIDLENQTFETESYTDLNKYFGGTGLGLKLLEMHADLDPLIISTGPLNGLFPFASKTSVVLANEGAVEDIYIGGSLSTRLKFAGIDSLIIHGSSKEKAVLDIQNLKVTFHKPDTDTKSLGLPGKRTLISFNGEKVLSDYYFTTPEDYLEKAFMQKNIKDISLTATENIVVDNFDDYKEIYYQILDKKKELRIDENEYPSCSGCPMGCGRSKVGEIGGNVLINSLVACQFADKIYTDIGIVFSCLNVLGYDYTHEDIENLPKLIEQTIRNTAL